MDDIKKLLFFKWQNEENKKLKQLSKTIASNNKSLITDVKYNILNNKSHYYLKSNHEYYNKVKLDNEYTRYVYYFKPSDFKSDLLCNCELILNYKFKNKKIIDKIVLEIGDKKIHEIPGDIIPELLKLYNLQISTTKNITLLPLPFDIFYNNNVLPVSLISEKIRITIDIKTKINVESMRLTNIYVKVLEMKKVVMLLKYIQYTKKYINENSKFSLYYHFFYHPIQIIYFCFIKKDKIITKKIFDKFELILDNYTYYSSSEEILKIDSQKFTDRDGIYSIQISPYDTHSRYVSQSCLNFSKINNVQFKFDFTINNKNDIKLYIFGLTNNIMEFKDNKSSLLF